MTLSIIAAKKILAMSIMLAAGGIGAKVGILDDSNCKVLNNVLMKILLPCMFFASYQQEFSAQKVLNIVLALVLGCAAHAIPIALGLVFRPGKDPNSQVDRFATIFGNCAFMGYPLIEAVAGTEGLLYATIFNIAFQLFLWTVGVKTMSAGGDRGSLKKIITNPAIIALALGLICFFTRFMLPEVIVSPIQSLSNCVTPVAMLVAGSSITRARMKQLFKTRQAYEVYFLRLIAMPLIMMVICIFFGLETNLALMATISAGCPVATLTIVLALDYDRDYSYASGIFGISTILSIVTLPLIVLLYQYAVNWF